MSKRSRETVLPYWRETLARSLHEALTERFPASCGKVRVSLEGAGAHWRCLATGESRRCWIACYGVDEPEYSTSFHEEGRMFAWGRSGSDQLTVDAVQCWIHAASLADLCRFFPFVQEFKQASDAALGIVTPEESWQQAQSMSVTDSLTVPPALVGTFPPSLDSLLAEISELVTDDMLVEISKSDYGDSASDHLEQLRKIRDTGRVPAPLLWEPREVLMLEAGSDRDDAKMNRTPGYTPERGHTIGAFCCAALLRGAIDDPTSYFTERANQTLIQLIHSAMRLGHGLPEAVAGFLTWRIPTDVDEEERPFFAFGLVALALLTAPQAFSPSQIDEFVGYVRRAERIARLEIGQWYIMDDYFLLDLTFYNGKHDGWKSLATMLRSTLPQHDSLVSLCQQVESAHGKRPK